LANFLFLKELHINSTRIQRRVGNKFFLVPRLAWSHIS